MGPTRATRAASKPKGTSTQPKRSQKDVLQELREQAREAAQVAARANEGAGWQHRVGQGLSSIASSLSQLWTSKLMILPSTSEQLASGIQMLSTVMDRLKETVHGVDERLHGNQAVQPEDQLALNNDLAQRVERMRWFFHKLQEIEPWDETKVIEWVSYTMDDSANGSEYLGSTPEISASNATSRGKNGTEETLESDAAGPPFIIYSSTNPPVNSLYSRTSEEFRKLAQKMADGDLPLSVQSPDPVVAWAETHYNHPQLVEMRSQLQIGGPMPAMLSPYEPGLVIFAATTTSVLKAASSLSQLSHLPVMIQPYLYNPALRWEAHDEADVVSDSANKRQTGKVLEGKIARLRGGAGSDSDSDADYEPLEGQPHMIKEVLSIPSSEGDDIEFDIISTSQFKIQREFRTRNRKGYRSRVVSSTRVKVFTTNMVTPIRSYSSVGFLIPEDHPRWIADHEWIDCGHGRPGQIHKTTSSDSKELSGELGYAGNSPVAKLAGKLGWTKGREKTNDKVTPNWIVKFARGRPDVNDNHCLSYDIEYEPTWITCWDDNVETINHLDVTFSIGINFNAGGDGKKKDIKRDVLPAKVTFIAEHQTMVWTRRDDLQSKGKISLILRMSVCDPRRASRRQPFARSKTCP
ncbi:hypothetical protein C8R47DRAFT_244550 [Mycena vitilis]|nr:hypothetical protein C8R47DRAFT_244550 [Mycena vitilis]